MRDDICELIDTLNELALPDGAISAYSKTLGRGWRINLDRGTFLNEIEVWTVIPQDSRLYPFELVSAFGNVEVFCLVKELPA